MKQADGDTREKNLQLKDRARNLQVCVCLGVGVCTEPAHTHFSACLVTGDLQRSKPAFFIDSLSASHPG